MRPQMIRSPSKPGRSTGVKRQHMGCAGRVENGINTVHLSYVREGVGHALIGFRQWIPDEHIGDPVKSARMGLPPGVSLQLCKPEVYQDRLA